MQLKKSISAAVLLGTFVFQGHQSHSGGIDSGDESKILFEADPEGCGLPLAGDCGCLVWA